MLQIVLQPHPKPVYLELLVYIYKMRKKAHMIKIQGFCPGLRGNLGKRKSQTFGILPKLEDCIFFFFFSKDLTEYWIFSCTSLSRFCQLFQSKGSNILKRECLFQHLGNVI